jgi:aspartyl-tRNA(Asn)/glutamyl-tRNA(Gln) amidotransferase subunit C
MSAVTVDLATIERLCKLAKLTLSEHDKNALVPDLSAIVDHVASLSLVDVDGLEPMVAPSHGERTTRPDQAQESLPREALLSGAPRSEDGAFWVPTFVEGA